MNPAHTVDTQHLERFRAFCEQAVPALERSKPKPPIEEFRQFVESAQPKLFESVSSKLHVIRDALQNLKPWLLHDRHDLLAVAQVTLSENPYTELVAWAIDPATNLEVATACQKAWLSTLGIDVGACNPVRPLTQLYTDDGIPDLVLQYSELLIVVEAKTGTDEHETPRSGQMQTVSYPSAVKRYFGKSEDFPTEIVFLTLDRSDATNAAAIRTSYFEFAVSLARTLNNLPISDDDELRPLYRLIVNHFATRTASLGRGISELLFLADEHSLDVRAIKHLATLTHVLHLLPERTGM